MFNIENGKGDCDALKGQQIVKKKSAIVYEEKNQWRGKRVGWGEIEDKEEMWG